MGERQKPTVMIRTYSSYNFTVANSSTLQQTESATKSERSTELFMNQTRSQTHRPQNRIFRFLNQIKGPSGSIRGHRDVVKKSLENINKAAGTGYRDFNSSNHLTSFQPLGIFRNNMTIQQLDEMYRLDYLSKLIDEEQNKCVLYTTTLGVIRRTFEDSKMMKSILNLNLIRYEERDIFLNQEYKLQLKMRCKSIIVPTFFVGGKHFGSLKELEYINENGRLPTLLASYKMPKATKEVCNCCGNARFIACQNCNGSRKSAIHHFRFNSIALRCIKCDRNDGLVRCPNCSVDGDAATQFHNSNITKVHDRDNNNFTDETIDISHF